MRKNEKGHNNAIRFKRKNEMPAWLLYALESISHSCVGPVRHMWQICLWPEISSHRFSFLSHVASFSQIRTRKQIPRIYHFFSSHKQKAFWMKFVFAPKSNWISNLFPSLIQSVHKHVKFFFSYLTEITYMDWKGYRTSDSVK